VFSNEAAWAAPLSPPPRASKNLSSGHSEHVGLYQIYITSVHYWPVIMVMVAWQSVRTVLRCRGTGVQRRPAGGWGQLHVSIGLADIMAFPRHCVELYGEKCTSPVREKSNIPFAYSGSSPSAGHVPSFDLGSCRLVADSLNAMMAIPN